MKDDKVMPLRSRFDYCLLEYKNNFEVEDKIKQIYINAKKIIDKIESVIGRGFKYY